MDDDYYYDHSMTGSYYDYFTSTSDYGLYEMCEAGEHELTIKMFQTCVFCLIFPLGIVGNSLVIATFALYRRLRLRSMTDVFLFHLAVADLLLLLTLPLQGVGTHLGWLFGEPLCKATRACYAVNTYSGLLLLACISLDRYMVVAQAQQALRLRSRMLTGGKLASTGVWLVALFLSLPEILFSGVTLSGKEAYCGMKIPPWVLDSRQVKMVTYGALIAAFCISFVVMVVCYSMIGRVLWEGHRHGRGKGWQHQRTLKLMVVLVLVFLVFQLPHTVVLSRKMVGHFCGLVLEYITCTLAYTRCCLNPILYALVGVRFRNDVLRLLHDAGCLCGFHLGPRPESYNSVSPSSPAVTMVSALSPTSPLHGPSDSEAAPASKFQFPVSDECSGFPKSFLFQRAK